MAAAGACGAARETRGEIAVEMKKARAAAAHSRLRTTWGFAVSADVFTVLRWNWTPVRFVIVGRQELS